MLKNFTHYRFLFLLLLLNSFIVFLSCQKEISDPDGGGSGVEIPAPGTPLLIEGIITDESGMPLQGVVVKAANLQATTDQSGSFRIADVRFTTNQTFVIATKAGYFNGSRNFIARQGSNNFLKIRMISRDEAGSVNAVAGGTVSVGNVTVRFPANAFVTATGADYTGQVSIKAAYLDPVDPALNQLMPGDLRGARTNGELRGLKTFGMVNVELESSTGQPLKLKPGVNAELNFTIPPALLASSPNTVPLWYFDEASGLWKEEGTVQKNGNNYTGTVNHFTFWNVDDPYQYVLLSMQIMSGTQGIPGLRVELTSITDSTSSFDYTDQNGGVNGYVPINTQLRREVFNDCDQLISSDLIGPFSSNTNLGILSLATLPLSQTINGTVTNCGGTPLASGYVIISTGGHSYYSTVTNGIYSAVFTNCNPGGSASIVAVNDSSQQQSNSITVQLVTPVVTAPAIQACGNTLSEFLTLTVDGVTRTWNMAPYDLYAIQDSGVNNGYYDLYVGAYDSVSTGSVDFIFFRPTGIPQTLPISLGIESLNVFDQLAPQSMLGSYYLDLIDQPARLTRFGPVGEVMEGSFSGQFIRNFPPISDTVYVSCSWKIIREQ